MLGRGSKILKMIYLINAEKQEIVIHTHICPHIIHMVCIIHVLQSI